MATRSQQASAARTPSGPTGHSGVDGAAASMMRMNMNSAPRGGMRVLPGMSGSSRRPKPGLTLGNMMGGGGGPGGGAGGAGLGAGRPTLNDIPDKRPPTAGTPFANFRKIVCVFPYVVSNSRPG